MAILGLQGVRGGTGVTSITAALAWALQLLGESVLAIDASPDNMLRFFFNTDIHHQDGWARALLDGRDWRDAGLRYTQHIDRFAIARWWWFIPTPIAISVYTSSPSRPTAIF